jgi:salicylate biosynthesis isochorismate synthase/menaquinone-specific isochorismate synthase
VSTLSAARSDWLSEAASLRLQQRLEVALRKARRQVKTIVVSVSEQLTTAVDPSAVVLASRRSQEAWQCLEQPDRGGTAIAGLGAAVTLESAGADRFTSLAVRWRQLIAAAVTDPPAGPPGSGLAAYGGFAFAPEKGSAPNWKSFAPASLVLPEVSLVRRDGATWLTVNAAVSADDTTESVLEKVHARLAELRQLPLPLLDPSPTGAFTVRSELPPSHYEEAVARGVQRIQAGELHKLVLAREVVVEAPRTHDVAAVFGVLREGFPTSYIYAVGRGDATFIGASPELLIRREGQRASTVALAGSIRRSADPSVDDHLGEQLLRSAKNREENLIVAQRIAAVLAPKSVWVTVAPEPVVIKVANIQHLAAPIRAQLKDSVSALELAGWLHPTPAVGGEPSDVAQRLIPALEGMDRGWFAGVVGWTDATEDGEFLVALRCALVRGSTASCYAGAGIVTDSDPASELAETEVKLGAVLPVLAG